MWADAGLRRETVGADAGLRRETVSWQREHTRSAEVEDHGRGDPSALWPAAPQHQVSEAKSGAWCVFGTGGVCVAGL